MGDKKYEPQARYIAKTRRRYVLNLNTNTDGEMLEHLEKIENVQGYIKALIKADMEKTPRE